MTVKKQYIDLGVVKADPEDYMAKYGSSLTSYDDLPDFIKEMKPPERLLLASQQNSTRLSHRLEGDLDALRLVDLEKESLSEYKSFLEKNSSMLDINRSQTIFEWDTPYEDFQSSISDELMFEQVLYKVQPQSKHVLTMDEAKAIMKLVKENKGKRFNEHEAEKLFLNMCPNKENRVDVVKFKRALFKSFF